MFKHLQLILQLLYELSTWLQDFVFRVMVSLILSAIVMPILYVGKFLNTYFFFDIGFLEILAICLTASLIMGARKHWILKDFSGRAMLIGLIEQTAVVTVAMIVCNAFSQIRGFNTSEGVKDYFDLFYKASIIIYLMISIFTSMSVITKGKFPPYSWFRNMKSFNRSGNMRDLISNDNTEISPEVKGVAKDIEQKINKIIPNENV